MAIIYGESGSRLCFDLQPILRRQDRSGQLRPNQISNPSLPGRWSLKRSGFFYPLTEIGVFFSQKRICGVSPKRSLQPWIHRFAFRGQYTKHALVHPIEWLVTDKTLQGFYTQSEFARGHRAFPAKAA